MSYGRRPSAHGGSDSQGAPCASCRHADDGEMSQWRDDKRVGVLKREGWEMALTADPLDVTDDQSPLQADSRPSYSNRLVKVSPVVIFSLVFGSICPILSWSVVNL